MRVCSDGGDNNDRHGPAGSQACASVILASQFVRVRGHIAAIYHRILFVGTSLLITLQNYALTRGNAQYFLYICYLSTIC